MTWIMSKVLARSSAHCYSPVMCNQPSLYSTAYFTKPQDALGNAVHEPMLGCIGRQITPLLASSPKVAMHPSWLTRTCVLSERTCKQTYNLEHYRPGPIQPALIQLHVLLAAGWCLGIMTLFLLCTSIRHHRPAQLQTN
jgi:hypothetical protein